MRITKTLMLDLRGLTQDIKNQILEIAKVYPNKKLRLIEIHTNLETRESKGTIHIEDEPTY